MCGLVYGVYIFILHEIHFLCFSRFPVRHKTFCANIFPAIIAGGATIRIFFFNVLFIFLRVITTAKKVFVLII